MYYHLILVVKYRRKVFDDAVSDRAKDIFCYIQEKANVDETMLNEKFAADMTEYAEAVLAGKKTLGILARGTDYTVLNMGDSKIQATVSQMISVIRKWLKEELAAAPGRLQPVCLRCGGAVR